MSRIKGSIKTGGRKSGTPNKVTGTLKEFITDLINQNRSQIERDLNLLQPRERLMILERLMQYIIPKRCEDLPRILPTGLKIEIVEPEGCNYSFPGSEADILP